MNIQVSHRVRANEDISCQISKADPKIEIEEPKVLCAHTVVDPRTVVVEFCHTSTTNLAVFRPLWSFPHTHHTNIIRVKFLRECVQVPSVGSVNVPRFDQHDQDHEE